MVRVLAIFFACTTAALGVVVVWLAAPQLRAAQQVRADEDIVFPAKLFVGTKAYVSAQGTLTGDWIGYKNNTYSIVCVPEECIVANVEQIGAKQIGSINGPITYAVKRWTIRTDALTWAGTYHGIGARLLREYAEQIRSLRVGPAPATSGCKIRVVV